MKYPISSWQSAGLTALGGLYLLSSSCSGDNVKKNDRKLNVVFFLADDLRWNSLGCAGNGILTTPNIDALARSGVRFSNACVTTSISMVSRANLLTGQYMSRHKIREFGVQLSEQAFSQTYPAILRKAGWWTGYVGKYGVGKIRDNSFDEPFSGFDPINVNLLRDEILELRKNGSTIIFSTHNMASVEELCDNIALINKSEKILDGPVNEIRRKYSTNSYQMQYRDFTGTPYQLHEAGIDVLNSSFDNGICTATFHLSGSKGPNDLLTTMLPHVNIISFNELIPSMNDVFISTVNAENANLILES